MPDVPTDFKNDREMSEIEWSAKQVGMTVDEFAAYATNKFIKKTKNDIHKHIQNPPTLRIIK